jgi:hypothetical protein
MEFQNTEIEIILIEKLEKKGIERCGMPLFLKDLVASLSIYNSMNISEINNRLNLLGWTDFELDYHTYQLAKAYFEN